MPEDSTGPFEFLLHYLPGIGWPVVLGFVWKAANFLSTAEKTALEAVNTLKKVNETVDTTKEFITKTVEGNKAFVADVHKAMTEHQEFTEELRKVVAKDEVFIAEVKTAMAENRAFIGIQSQNVRDLQEVLHRRAAIGDAHIEAVKNFMTQAVDLYS